MIKIDETDPVGEIDPSFPYRNVTIKRSTEMKDSYDLQKEIGRGKFGTVFRCTEKSTGLKLAAKFISVAKRQDRRNAEREVEIMTDLQHPRLIQIYDAYEINNTMCVILELIEGGELFERVIDDDFVLTEKSVSIFMKQICEGVAFIHSKSILHLDMKPENILCLTRNGNRIKIIDFGLARRYDPKQKLQVLFGTPEFVAPEVVNFDAIGYGTDMWSVGVICYVLLSGLSPFMGETDVQTMSNVTIAQYDFDDEAFNDISKDAKDFISKLLVKDKEVRLSATECLSHPWLHQRNCIKSNEKPCDELLVSHNAMKNELEFSRNSLRNLVDRWNDDGSILTVPNSNNCDILEIAQESMNKADGKSKSDDNKINSNVTESETPLTQPMQNVEPKVTSLSLENGFKGAEGNMKAAEVKKGTTTLKVKKKATKKKVDKGKSKGNLVNDNVSNEKELENEKNTHGGKCGCEKENSDKLQEMKITDTNVVDKINEAKAKINDNKTEIIYINGTLPELNESKKVTGNNDVKDKIVQNTAVRKNSSNVTLLEIKENGSIKIIESSDKSHILNKENNLSQLDKKLNSFSNKKIKKVELSKFSKNQVIDKVSSNVVQSKIVLNRNGICQIQDHKSNKVTDTDESSIISMNNVTKLSNDVTDKDSMNNIQSKLTEKNSSCQEDLNKWINKVSSNIKPSNSIKDNLIKATDVATDTKLLKNTSRKLTGKNGLLCEALNHDTNSSIEKTPSKEIENDCKVLNQFDHVASNDSENRLTEKNVEKSNSDKKLKSDVKKFSNDVMEKFLSTTATTENIECRVLNRINNFPRNSNIDISDKIPTTKIISNTGTENYVNKTNGKTPTNDNIDLTASNNITEKVKSDTALNRENALKNSSNRIVDEKEVRCSKKSVKTCEVSNKTANKRNDIHIPKKFLDLQKSHKLTNKDETCKISLRQVSDKVPNTTSISSAETITSYKTIKITSTENSNRTEKRNTSQDSFKIDSMKVLDKKLSAQNVSSPTSDLSSELNSNKIIDKKISEPSVSSQNQQSLIKVEVTDGPLKRVKKKTFIIKNISENSKSSSSTSSTTKEPLCVSSTEDNHTSRPTCPNSEKEKKSWSSSLHHCFSSSDLVLRRRISDITSLLSGSELVEEEMASLYDGLNKIVQLRRSSSSTNATLDDNVSIEKRPKFRLSCFSRDVSLSTSKNQDGESLGNYFPSKETDSDIDGNNRKLLRMEQGAVNRLLSATGTNHHVKEKMGPPSLTRKLFSRFFGESVEYDLTGSVSSPHNFSSSKDKITGLI